MLEREILKALEFSSNNSNSFDQSTTVASPVNQTMYNSTTSMPKILLEDEVKKPVKIAKQEQIEQPKVEYTQSNNSSSTFNLESIFTKEFLTKISVEDLDKSLKDIILSNHQKEDEKLAWNYYENNQDYVCEVKFETKELLNNFLASSFDYVDSIYRLDSPLSLELYISKQNKDNINNINNIYSTIVKKKVKSGGMLELDQKKSLQIPLSYQGEIVQKFDNGKDYYIKVPVAKIGTWKHPVYEEVRFTSEDLDAILYNFENNELGFEPPIYFGHSSDGTPAQGYLVKLEKDNDILFGYWKVNKEAYRLVEDEIYRYSSAEIILNLTSKASGNKIGKAVYGMALTNIPFVPDLPKVQALEDVIIKNDVVFLSFSNNDTTIIDKDKPDNKNSVETKDMQETNTQMNSIELALKEQVEAYAAKVKELELTRQELEQANKLKELKAQIETYSQKESEYGETAQKLSVVVEQNKQLADKIEQYEQSIRAKEVETKVTKLESLPLPTEFKQVYSNLIKENRLGEVEGIVLSSLESLAQSYTQSIVDQSGSTETTNNLNNVEYEDPYKAEIERCKRLIEQRIK